MPVVPIPKLNQAIYRQIDNHPIISLFVCVVIVVIVSILVYPIFVPQIIPYRINNFVVYHPRTVTSGTYSIIVKSELQNKFFDLEGEKFVTIIDRQRLPDHLPSEKVKVQINFPGELFKNYDAIIKIHIKGEPKKSFDLLLSSNFLKMYIINPLKFLFAASLFTYIGSILSFLTKKSSFFQSFLNTSNNS